MNEIVGKWQQPEGQAFPGLWFGFQADGTFDAALESMSITSGGTYSAANGEIDIDQTRHTLGLLGHFAGRYAIQGDMLTMNLGDPGSARPDGLEGRNKRNYIKIK
ncbi:MAG: hypothetical protein JW934_11735 [Anaerolineae bacterium]|nr:hypothetical protein [Anaerolineae bacterium]